MLYPRTGTTKGEVLNYYAQIAPMLLPHLKDRAVTRIRWPHGVEDMSFFEKNAPGGTPSWVRTVTVPTTGRRAGKDEGTITFPVIDDLATLTWLVNLAALELHVHQWTVGRNGRPRNADRLVIDLDPGEPAGLHECCQVALLVRDTLAERDLDGQAGAVAAARASTCTPTCRPGCPPTSPRRWPRRWPRSCRRSTPRR